MFNQNAFFVRQQTHLTLTSYHPHLMKALSRLATPGGLLPALILVATAISGCAQMSAVQLAGSAVGLVLEATGVVKKDADPSKTSRDMSVRIYAGEQLNLSSSGKPLSLVAKIYVLRANEKFKGMTYPQITSPEAEKEALGEELISSREIVLLPGKPYDITLKVPGDATAIGVVGMFRAPYQGRWKLAFDNKLSFDNGITIGAHACAFNASKGALIVDISPETMRSLVGVQCNS